MRIFLFFSFLFFSSLTSAHEFFFAFAEMEYNELNGRFELSLTATTHDLDKLIQLTDPGFKGLHQASGDSISLQQVEHEINRHMILSIPQENSILDGTNAVYFHLEGIETELNGTVHLFLYATYRTIPAKLEMTFDLLMEQFPEQQNKLTFIHRGKKSTYVFLPNQRTQIIELIQL